MRPFALLLLLVLSGCAIRPPEYIVTGDGARLSREEAQETIIARYLAVQVEPPLDDPIDIIAASLPDYPAALRSADIEGIVRVRFLVDSNGIVRSPSVVGAPPAPLTAISLASIVQWQFRPLKRNGEAVEHWFTFDFEFRLEG